MRVKGTPRSQYWAEVDAPVLCHIPGSVQADTHDFPAIESAVGAGGATNNGFTTIS